MVLRAHLRPAFHVCCMLALTCLGLHACEAQPLPSVCSCPHALQGEMMVSTKGQGYVRNMDINARVRVAREGRWRVGWGLICAAAGEQRAACM